MVLSLLGNASGSHQTHPLQRVSWPIPPAYSGKFPALVQAKLSIVVVKLILTATVSATKPAQAESAAGASQVDAAGRHVQ